MSEATVKQIDPDKVPQHVAFIMDGNGRWAAARNQPRIMGHRKGADTVRMVTRTSINYSIPYITLYAFSSENWKRPRKEVEFLMRLLEAFLDSELKELQANGVQFRTIGELDKLPEHILKKINHWKEVTRNNTRLTLCVALNYGSRGEIVRAINRIVAKQRKNPEEILEINEDSFSEELETAGIPDPDLLIRTSGEFRLSNFLLWQCSYSEIHVSQKLWPEFKEEDYVLALKDFAGRNRRFGALS